MVLWEITLATAYFLGLKRTYKLALRIQRRLIGPKHPKIRQFAQRRTRAVFDVAVKVHTNIQQRDIEAGRNLGNWMLRWLDKMKPSAEIRGSSPLIPRDGTKQLTESSRLKTHPRTQNSKYQESDRQLFMSAKKFWRKSFPTVSMTMRSTRPSGIMTQYRQLSIVGPEMATSNNFKSGASRFEGVIRKDIMQYLLRN